MKWTGEQIYIRPLEADDVTAFYEMNTRNREFWGEFEPDFDRPEPTFENTVARIQQVKERAANDHSYFLGIFLKETDELIGDVSLAEVFRGPLQSCIVGYSLDKAHNGKGYTTEAVRLAVRYAFEVLNLHRLEAGVMPHNMGSRRVLEKAGFHYEGIARQKLKIKGVWQDHCQYSMLRSDWERLID